jgi:hypothetical protein
MATISFVTNGVTQQVPVMKGNYIDVAHMPPRRWDSKAPVPGTWYRNNTGYEMGLYAQTTYGTGSNTVTLEIRDSGGAVTWMSGDFNATSTGKNFSVSHVVPAGWEYRVTLGTGQTLGRFLEFAYRG